MGRSESSTEARAEGGSFVIDEALPPIKLFEEWIVPLIFLTLFGLGVAGVLMADGNGGMVALGSGMMVLAVGLVLIGLWPYLRSMRARRETGVARLSLPRWPLRIGELLTASIGGLTGTKPELSARLVCREEVRGVSHGTTRVPHARTPITLHREIRSIDVTCRPNANGATIADLELQVPQEAPSSFLASYNKVIWELNLQVKKDGVTRETKFPLWVAPEVVA